MPALRDFQAEDVRNVLEAHQTHQSVLGRAATGLGKAVELAELVSHYSQTGRVMVLVDVTKLVRQLAATIFWYTGSEPGIEMADERANNGQFLKGKDRVIVSTVQTQYSGDEGTERYRLFDPKEFSCLLLDETELFLAPKARSVVDYYTTGNPDIKVFGCTATPIRTDGVTMGELFTHVAFDRDILWGRDNGWLVKPRQAFVRVSLDFSTMKVRKNEDGERDYSDAEIAEKIENEQTLIELAKGIHEVAKTRKSIVVCPNVSSAKAVSHYIDAESPGCARVIYGEMADKEKDSTFYAFENDEFQFLVSVMMLTKGFDSPNVSAVFNCRKTRSKRLYTQVMGRGTRPHKTIVAALNACEGPSQRLVMIADSIKPDMLMVNMVGIDDEVRDITILDILTATDTKIRDRATKNMLDSDAESADPAEAVAEAEAQLAEEEEKRKRRLIKVKANVDVEYVDDLRTGGMVHSARGTYDVKLANAREVCRKFRVTDNEMAKMSAETIRSLSGQLIARCKAKLCSWRQAKVLRKNGYSREQLRGMSFADASLNLDAIAKRQGWK